jgi:hypothetical protein
VIKIQIVLLNELIASELSKETENKSTSESVYFLGGKFPPKPRERGTLGRLIKLLANHYPISIKPFKVYQYDVDFVKKFLENNKQVEKQIKIKETMRYYFLFD